MASRRAARMAAVEVLYAADVRSAEVQAVLDERAEETEVPEYATHLALEAHRRRTELDELIAARSIGWAPERMSPVDRNVLRVAVLEFLEGDVPAASVIDEAVRIAKRLSGERAGGFVNGVLSAVLRELQASERGSGGG